MGRRAAARAGGLNRAGPLRGLFVTGTGTEVGKTIVASAIAAALAERGERVAVFKPAVTGLDEPGAELPDHELLRASACSAQAREDVAPYRFGPPVSPHLAAEQAGVRIEPGLLAARARRACAGADVLVVEGVGGLLVPLTPDYLVRDLARELGLPLIVVALPGLGTINHSLMTIESARSAGLEVRGVVLTPWPPEPAAIERSNRDTIAALSGVPVATLGRVEVSPSVGPAGLPVDRWLPEIGAGDVRRAVAGRF